MKERLAQQRWHLSNLADARALPLADARALPLADARALPLADRHYNRQKIGSPQFVPPGSCVVFLTEATNALWVTSWPKGEYVQHAWPGAWINSCFRNEAPEEFLSSDLIREAVAATRAAYGKAPKQGMVTFVDAEKTHHKRDPGRCYLKAGFKKVGETQAGLIVLQLAPEDTPMALGALPMIRPIAEGSAA